MFVEYVSCISRLSALNISLRHYSPISIFFNASISRLLFQLNKKLVLTENEIGNITTNYARNFKMSENLLNLEKTVEQSPLYRKHQITQELLLSHVSAKLSIPSNSKCKCLSGRFMPEVMEWVHNSGPVSYSSF